MFTGDVWYDVIAQSEEPLRIRVDKVRFSSSTRTAWHFHVVGQMLYVSEGVGLVQSPRRRNHRDPSPAMNLHTPPASGTGTERPPTTHDAHPDVGSAPQRPRVGMGSPRHRR